MRTAALLLLLTAVAGVALAQGTTASLTGTVTSGGNPLPGATVTISSPALQGTRDELLGNNRSVVEAYLGGQPDLAARDVA